MLCVIAIIAILASLLLPAVFRAYNKARAVAEEVEGPAIIALIAQETRGYCIAHTQYLFLSRSELIKKVGYAPKAHDWLAASTTEFEPFGYLDQTNVMSLSPRQYWVRGIETRFSQGLAPGNLCVTFSS